MTCCRCSRPISIHSLLSHASLLALNSSFIVVMHLSLLLLLASLPRYSLFSPSLFTPLSRLFLIFSPLLAAVGLLPLFFSTPFSRDYLLSHSPSHLDLPLPTAPTTATSSPFLTSRVHPCRAGDTVRRVRPGSNTSCSCSSPFPSPPPAVVSGSLKNHHVCVYAKKKVA